MDRDAPTAPGVPSAQSPGGLHAVQDGSERRHDFSVNVREMSCAHSGKGPETAGGCDSVRVSPKLFGCACGAEQSQWCQHHSGDAVTHGTLWIHMSDSFAISPRGPASGTHQKSTPCVGSGVNAGPAQVSGVHSEPDAGSVLGSAGKRIAGGSRIGKLWRAAVYWAALLGAVSCHPARADDAEYVSNVVAAIYRVEGGDKTKYPYGIKSVKVSGKDEAKRVCENTVRNNLARWRKAGAKGEYLDFLADRYCPPSVDPKGNLNWKNNIKKIITCP